MERDCRGQKGDVNLESTDATGNQSKQHPDDCGGHAATTIPGGGGGGGGSPPFLALL